MTPRRLFSIVLKIFGLFFLKEIVEIILQLISTILYFSRSDTASEGVWTLVLTLLMIAVYVLVSYQLLFNTNKIIDTLSLDKGFDQEEFSFKISSTSILEIAVIVIGGMLLANEIPNLCRYLFLYFQEKRITFGQTQPTISYSIVAGVKIIIGALFIGERRRIVEFMERKNGETSGG